MNTFLLIAGIPRAGKTTLAGRVEDSDCGLTHIPLDKYIKPVPKELSFLQWVRTMRCIDWDLLNNHIGVLESGRDCYTPNPNWSIGGIRSSPGGALTNGDGKKMQPSEYGSVIPGTHAFSFDGHPGIIRVYVETPDEVIASRLEGKVVASSDTQRVITRHLGSNPAPLRLLKAKADLVVSGVESQQAQLEKIRLVLATHNPGD